MPFTAVTARPRWGLGLVYAGLLMAMVAGFLLIERLGAPLTAPAGPAGARASGAAASGHQLLHVLLALAAVITVGRLLGALLKVVGQPPVIGEVVAGILLGPSLLGLISPAASKFILPTEVAPLLGVIAQLGVILYMFLVGLELDVGEVKNQAHATVAISHAGIVVPFLSGAALALALYPRLAYSDVSFQAFALFLGVAMSITAFPVLARILTDRGLHRSPLGAIALTCAATDDVTAWCLLAFVVGVTQSHTQGLAWILGGAVGFVAVMLLVARPLLARFAARQEGKEASVGAVAIMIVAVLLAAAATEAIGIHALFGAFVVGAVVPHQSTLARSLVQRLSDLVGVVLLPSFFALTGLRTQIGLVSGWENWGWCGVIILVATFGKFGGTLTAARLAGIGWRDASALGVLMNTRGLMELIVLNIGLELGVIAPRLYAMMVIMALATTFATTPALTWIRPQSAVEA